MDRSFQESCFLLLDRIERVQKQLREELQSADDYLLLTHARINDLLGSNGPGLPSILVSNRMPQTIGVTAGWNDGRFVVVVSHRGVEAEHMLPSDSDLDVMVQIAGAEVAE